MNANTTSNNRPPTNKRKRLDVANYEDEWHQVWWTWTPNAVSLQYKETGEALISPVYPDQDSELQWRILLFPRGTEPESCEYFSLFLELITELRDFDVHANFSFYLRSGNGKNFSHKMSCEHRFHADELTCGFPKYLRRSDMLDGFNGVLCHVRAKKICPDQSSNNGNNDEDEPNMEDTVESSLLSREYTLNTSSRLQDSRLKVTRDLEVALNNGAFSDVMLVAGGKMFKAHRIMLAARSTVFASMLENNKQSIELDVSEQVLKEILKFVYTGSVSTVTGKLMIAANTYSLEDLHSLCQEELARYICIQNAGNVLILADQAKGKKLKRDVMRFISCHAKEFIKTAAYKRMVLSHLYLIEELYRFEHDASNRELYEEDSEYF